MEIKANSDIQMRMTLWGNKKEIPLDIHIHKPFL